MNRRMVVRGKEEVGKGVLREIVITDLIESGKPFDKYVRVSILNSIGNIMSSLCCRKDVLKQTVEKLE